MYCCGGVQDVYKPIYTNCNLKFRNSQDGSLKKIIYRTSLSNENHTIFWSILIKEYCIRLREYDRKYTRLSIFILHSMSMDSNRPYINFKIENRIYFVHVDSVAYKTVTSATLEILVQSNDNFQRLFYKPQFITW